MDNKQRARLIVIIAMHHGGREGVEFFKWFLYMVARRACGWQQHSAMFISFGG